MRLAICFSFPMDQLGAALCLTCYMECIKGRYSLRRILTFQILNSYTKNRDISDNSKPGESQGRKATGLRHLCYDRRATEEVTEF